MGDINNNSNNHNKQGNRITVDVESAHGLLMWCTEHESRCTHICTDSTHDGTSKGGVTFLCVYCRHRNHNGHTVETITDSVKKLAGRLEKSSSSMDNLLKIRQSTEQQVAGCTRSMAKILRQRKLERISSYIKEVCAEEKRLWEQLTLICRNHLKSYA